MLKYGRFGEILVLRTRFIYLKEGDGFSCSGDKIYRLGSSRSCVFVSVGVRHRRQVGQIQGSSSRSH